MTEHRKSFAYQSWIGVGMSEIRERRVIGVDDIWRALLFLFFSIVSFFGTGNLVGAGCSGTNVGLNALRHN